MEGYSQAAIIGYSLEEGTLNIPSPERIDNETLYPYVVVGDEAFSLKTYLMKPYPRAALDIKERIFNYRLSRARRIIENCTLKSKSFKKY